MNLITIFVCLFFLPVSFFFYLVSLTVNKTVQQEKLLKTKTNIVGTKAWSTALLRKCTIFMGKIFHASLNARYEKSIAYKQLFRNFPALCAIMRFYGIMQIMRSELNYAILHRRIIPEALYHY